MADHRPGSAIFFPNHWKAGYGLAVVEPASIAAALCSTPAGSQVPFRVPPRVAQIVPWVTWLSNVHFRTASS